MVVIPRWKCLRMRLYYIFFRTNVLHHLDSNTLPGIACKSVESMIKFCRFRLIVYFISKEDKDYQTDVIGCIFDDVIPGFKKLINVIHEEDKDGC